MRDKPQQKPPKCACMCLCISIEAHKKKNFQSVREYMRDFFVPGNDAKESKGRGGGKRENAEECGLGRAEAVGG